VGSFVTMRTVRASGVSIRSILCISARKYAVDFSALICSMFHFTSALSTLSPL